MENKKRNKPKRRFAGFTDDWEERKLGELGEIMTGSTPSTSNSEYYSEDGIPWVTPTDINSQTISDTPRKLSEEGMKVGRVVPANTILCTCIASIGKNTLLTVKGSFNQQINCLTPNEYNDAYFLLTESVFWSNIMKRMAAAGTMQIVNKTEFSELTTMVPKLEEQKKIGQYFRALDHLITLHQRKLDKLGSIKKSYLSEMFPQEGEKKPKRRFKGFTDDWEQRKLGEIATFINGRAYSQDELLNSGKYKVLRVGNFYTNDSWYYSDMELDDKYYAENGDLLYTWSATFGPHIWHGNKVIYHYHIWKIELSKALEKNFALQLLERDKQAILSDKNGSTMVHITKAGMERKEVLLPTNIVEQVKIGEYFTNLDHLITLHQRKLEKLKNIKQAYLNEMFV